MMVWLWRWSVPHCCADGGVLSCCCAVMFVWILALSICWSQHVCGNYNKSGWLAQAHAFDAFNSHTPQSKQPVPQQQYSQNVAHVRKGVLDFA